MTTGERIKAARKSVGMTQAALAEKLGISYVGVSQWENDIRNPKLSTLKRIADALDTTVESLLGIPSKITMDENLLDEFSEGLSDGLSSVMLLQKDEQKPFYDLIKDVIIMMCYCRCIGKENDLMGQNTAIKQFISASVNLTAISANLTKQAMDKYQERNHISKEPSIKISFSSEAPKKEDD